MAFKKGVKHSEEHKRKISEALKGRKNPWTTKRNLENNPMNNEETRKKMAESQKGKTPWQKKLGDNHSKVIEYKKRMIEQGRKNLGNKAWNQGLTKEDPRVLKYTKHLKGNKFGKANKGQKKPYLTKRNLENNPMKNPETRKKVGEKLKGMFALEKNPMWHGGKSFEPYTTDWTNELRKLVRERDSHKCQVCGKKGNQVHHIDYIKENSFPDNLITLCASCHSKTNIRREKWQKHFSEKLKNAQK